MIASEIIDLNYKEKTEEHAASILLSLSKVSSLRPGTGLIDEGFWRNIQTKEPIIDYDD